MKIRKMKETDLDQIIDVEHALFTSPWKRQDFLYELNENPFSYLCVLEENNLIVGYYDCWVTFETAQLCNIGVSMNYQGKGYSKLLMDHMIDYVSKQLCEVITLEVRVSNKKAISLYEKYGFIEVNIKKGYYQDNFEDALYMIKPLGGNL